MLIPDILCILYATLIGAFMVVAFYGVSMGEVTPETTEEKLNNHFKGTFYVSETDFGVEITAYCSSGELPKVTSFFFDLEHSEVSYMITGEEHNSIMFGLKVT